MTDSQRKRFAALQRLVDHPDTPEHERENARARIAEMKEKYGEEVEQQKTPFGIPYPDPRGGPFGTSMADILRDMAEQMGVDVGDVFTNSSRAQYRERTRRRWPENYSPYHEYGTGDIPKRPFVNTENPFEEDGHFTGRRLSDFVRFVVRKWENQTPEEPGPYGRVSHVTGGTDADHGNAVFNWRCGECGEKVSRTVSWKKAGYARKEPAAMDQLLKELFTIWNGHSDNKCPRCSRFTEVNDPSWKGQWKRWCEGKFPGRFGRILEFETARDMKERTLIFSWKCPRCSTPVELKIGDELLGSGEDMVHAVDQVFMHLNGDKWNWCDHCQKVKEKFDEDCEEARTKGPQHHNCRCTTSDFPRGSGSMKFKTYDGVTVKVDGVEIGKFKGVYVPEDEED